METLANTFWTKYNRLHEAKITHTLEPDEFSNLLETVSEMIINRVKTGKMNEETAMNIYNDYYSQFSTENGDKFFDLKHNNLRRAYKYFSEGLAVALMDIENKKNMMNQSINKYLIDDEDHKSKTL